MIRGSIEFILEQKDFFIGICRRVFFLFLLMNFLSLSASLFPNSLIAIIAILALIWSIAVWLIRAVLAVATHRYIILGERREEISLYQTIGRREFTFAGLGIAISIALAIVMYVVARAAGIVFPEALGLLFVFVVLLLGFFVLGPLLLVFPAIAVDKFSDFFSHTRILSDYRGTFFAVYFAALIVTIIPAVLISISVAAVFGVGSQSNVVLLFAGAAGLAAYDLALTFFFVVIASLLYKEIFAATPMNPMSQSHDDALA